MSIRHYKDHQQQATGGSLVRWVKIVRTAISSAVLTQRSEAPSGAGVAAALATGVATATLTHAGTGNAAPG